jgi:endoglucanase
MSEAEHTPICPLGAHGAKRGRCAESGPFSLGRQSFWLLLAALGGCAGSKAAPASGGSVAASYRLSAENNLIRNSSFEDGTSLPWTTSFTDPAQGEAVVKQGAFCLRVDNVGDNPWDAQVRHREMVIQSGHSYEVSFVAFADKPTKVRAKVGMAGPPYAEYWTSTIELSPKRQRFQGGFRMPESDDPTAEFAFHVGGGLAGAAPLEVCFDDVVLADPEFRATGSKPEAPSSPLRVNQVGYFPKGQKLAVFVSAASAPVPFELVNAEGATVHKGQTQVLGPDRDSGEPLHLIDFGAFQTPGKGYRLRIGDEQSASFAIDSGLYEQLKYDALSYFYHNRSGIELKLPYARRAEWARPAGHLSDVSVPCAKDAGCSYSLDVSGGWYDAGDHGKYVVNGGISVWTLLSAFERAQSKGKEKAFFGDGKLNIPESGNGTPDLLDEVRWQLEFHLKMQVPEGEKLAGMVHHKIHDEAWTALGLAPHEAQMKRYLRPVSTAATLNLAANGAQCARLYKAVDAPFAARCLAAAERAWKAAQEHPAMFAPASDKQGGGPYDDSQVTDDFYWAAAELFISTGKPEYLTHLKASQHHARFTMNAGSALSSMNWARTDTLGKLSLLTVPSSLPAEDRKLLEEGVVKAADEYLEAIAKQGYRVPLQGGSGGRYPWGSNSFVLNNMIVLGTAYDLKRDKRYLDGVVLGMDYLLGRNAVAMSYVTGYGEKALENPHHRFWSHQVNSKYPKAPPGAVSGGPNSGLEDPYVKAAGLAGCAPQKCFVDHIEAWSVNEITINWNAPLVWVTAFLNEAAR